MEYFKYGNEINQQFFENAADGILIIDSNQKIVYYNNEASKIFLYTNNELIGKPLSVLIPENTRDVNDKHIAQYKLQSNHQKMMAKERLDIKGLTKKNTLVGIEISLTKITVKSTQYTVAVIRETKNKMATLKEELDQDKQFKSLFEYSFDAIILASDEAFFDCNKAALDLFGYKNKSEFLKIGPIDISPKLQSCGTDSATLFKRRIVETLRKGNMKSDWLYQKKDGSTFTGEVSAKVILIENETFFQTIIKDVTTLREQEEKLKLANFELENSLEREKELGKLKTSFVSMASHEFRTPLAAIKATADVIQRYCDKLTKEDVDKRLNKIKKEVNDMTTILEDILIIGKSDSQKLQFNPIVLNMNETIKNIISEYQLSEYATREVKFNFQSENIMANADLKWTKLIVINLLSNAFKYSADDKAVIISMKENKNKVVFSFQDFGIGIAQEEFDRLYDPFHRGENIGNISGTGLGLSVLQKAVELHNGSIEVQSEIGKGSKFTVTLPQ